MEGLAEGVTATNEPTHIECGAPDFIITKGSATIGYVEAKDIGKSLDEAEKSEQLQRYLGSLTNLILTDYLEFRWYVDGECRLKARLGTPARDGKIRRDKGGAEAVAELLGGFLPHRAERVGTPKELAERMARQAHMIRNLIVAAFEKEPEGGSLHTQLVAFRDNLIPDLSVGQFADMYAQTLAYGLFAARCTSKNGASFTRLDAAINLPRTNPFLRKLFQYIAGYDLDDHIVWLVDDLAQLLAQADMDAVLQDFGKRTAKEDPVVHFYETFLKEYDEKIREMRGKKARALEGRIPGGGSSKIYGYDYIKVSRKNGGRRTINETEASWVRQIYQWLVNNGLATNAITYRLRALNAPSKSGKIWNRRSVQAILKNPAYTGKTYVFTTAKGGKQFTRPQEDWIEIPDTTPAIISQEMFEAAQRQLRVNRGNATRNNKKYQYLLRGHLRCCQCGRSYVGSISQSTTNNKLYIQRYYRCTGKLKVYAPVERCQNKGWSANKLESMVWTKLEEYLSKPELIVSELEKQHQDADQLGMYETQLQDIERQLKAVDREQHQLLQWALKGFPANQVEAENRWLNKARETLKDQKTEMETQIKAGQDAVINIPKLESFIERMQSRISALDFESKRQVLDMLNITVWLDGENVDITGVIPTEDVCIVHTQS